MFKNIYIRNSLLASAALLAAGFGIAYVSLKDVEHLLVVHFVGGRGLDFLGTRRDVLGILFTGLAVAALNVCLMKAFYPRKKFFAYLFGYFTIFFSLLILIAVGVILSVN